MNPRPTLHADEVHIWRADASQATMAADAADRILSVEERDRADRFHFQRDRQRFVAARAALRVILGAYVGIAPEKVPFAYNRWGKPAIPAGHSPAPVEFNVSHSANEILIAVSLADPVGVDIQRIDWSCPILELARTVLSPREYAALCECEPGEQAQAFFRNWVRKEAYLKAIGVGLSTPLSEVDCGGSADSRPHLGTVGPGGSAHANLTLQDVLLPSPDYLAAFAVLKRDASMRLLQFENRIAA